MLALIYRTFPAMSEVHFRRFWLSQWVALIGLWMQLTAQQWLVYSLTRSPLLLGLLGVAQFGPIMLFSLPAGVLVDRIAKRSLVRFTQAAYCAQALLLALLVFTGWVNYYNVLFLAFLYGCIQTIDTPARQSYVAELVQPQNLRSAISMNSANFNVARMIGPAIAAVVMAKYGAGWLFFANAVLMIPVLWTYWNLPIVGEPKAKEQAQTPLSDMRDGISYATHNMPVYSTLIVLFIISTFIMNYNVIAPVYADLVLHRGVTGFGLITSAVGVGSFTAALLSASLADGRPSARLLFGSALTATSLLFILALFDSFYLALGMFAVFGFFVLTFLISANTLVQMNTELAYRGRILSLYSLVFLGATPPGNLLTGWLIEWLGVRFGIMTCALLSFLLLIPIGRHVCLRLQKDPHAFQVDS